MQEKIRKEEGFYMMRRNFKKSIAVALLIFSLLTTIELSTVEAAMSSWMESPAIPVGGVSERSKATRLSGTAKTATAEDAFAQFNATTFGYLPTTYASGVNRAIFVYLKELDDKNDDDLIAVYSGGFYGRKLMGLAVRYVYAEGSIESTGDSAAELYINVVLNESMYDDVNACTPAGLFDFRVGMN